jgi:fermentation-respiration switch protein FrsA (DUF1100 family)
MHRLLICIALLLAVGLSVSAQADVQPEVVSVTAADGLVLIGDFYRLGSEGQRPAVILLHGSGSFRREWNHFIQPLLDAGFHVLNVDQRGHGETGGRRDLGVMIDDMAYWSDWLLDQPDVLPGGIAMIGSSMGTVPALGGCAHEPACYTAILVSPGDFPLLTDEVYASLDERSILFMVGRDDSVVYDTRRMFARAVGEVALHIYPSAVHGSSMFLARSPHRVGATNLVIGWLRDHLPAA